MTLSSAEQLRRLAAAVREEIAPEVSSEYPRTQAFMASVILQRVAREVELADEHRAAEQQDVAALEADLRSILSDAPPGVRAAASGLGTGAVAMLRPVIAELYAWDPMDPAARQALARIRAVLRSDIDRRMEIAR